DTELARRLEGQQDPARRRSGHDIDALITKSLDVMGADLRGRLRVPQQVELLNIRAAVLAGRVQEMPLLQGAAFFALLQQVHVRHGPPRSPTPLPAYVPDPGNADLPCPLSHPAKQRLARPATYRAHLSGGSARSVRRRPPCRSGSRTHLP